MIRLIVILLLLTGCAGPQYHISGCGPRAVECALTWGAVVGFEKTAIAISPTDGEDVHAQAIYNDGERLHWLVNAGHECRVGNREYGEGNRIDDIYTVWQFVEGIRRGTVRIK